MFTIMPVCILLRKCVYAHVKMHACVCVVSKCVCACVPLEPKACPVYKEIRKETINLSGCMLL